MKAKIIKTGEIVEVYHETQHGQVSNIYKEAVFLNGRMWAEDELDFCMEANEAPEKLYILFGLPYVPDYTKFNKRRHDEDVEYIRTDVFINKTCEFIKNRFYFDDSWHVEGETSISDKVIEDFKNYIKGE